MLSVIQKCVFVKHVKGENCPVPIKASQLSAFNYYCNSGRPKLNMKGFTVSVFVSVALLAVCAGKPGKPFDDKSDAIKEIDQKFNQVLQLGNVILKAAEEEKKNTNTKGESELLTQLDNKVDEARNQVERDANAVIKTAIVKAKPVSVIHCIRTVSSAGHKKIDSMYDAYWEKVVLIRLKKIEKIEFDVSAVKAILGALKDLTDQAKTKINEGGIILTLKREALQNCQSSELLLGEIEVNLHEPILSREYIKMRQEIERTLTKIKSEINTDLEKCLGEKPAF